MPYDINNLTAVLPEIFLLSAACIILILDAFLRQRYRMVTYVLSLVSLVGTLAFVVAGYSTEHSVLFENAFVKDPMADVLKVAILVVAFIAFVYSKDYLRQNGLFKGEFYVLGQFSVLGMMVMVSANSFLTVYLGLELLSLTLYALVAFDRKSKLGSEAAMKYFVLGALASGLLLYGISMIYGATGAFDFPGISAAIAGGATNQMVMMFGLVFVIIGIGFKFGAVPFHMWIPDVYHGAPLAVTVFLGSVPKIAAFAMAMRVLVDGMGALNLGWEGWQGMLILFAIASMAVGNIVAIAQDNIKRMFGYSTISHVGFIFLGLLAGTNEGYTAAMFYAIVYAITAAGGFGVLILMSRKGFEAENIHDLKGLNERSPWLAFMMMLLLFSMAGVPPTVGFFAKLFVLDAVISIDLTWLALVAVFFSIIGAYYYIRVVKVIYFDKPITEEPIVASVDAQIVMSINGLAMLLLGFFPASLLAICTTAIAGM